MLSLAEDPAADELRDLCTEGVVAVTGVSAEPGVAAGDDAPTRAGPLSKVISGVIFRICLADNPLLERSAAEL